MHEVQGSSPCKTTIVQDFSASSAGILYFFVLKDFRRLDFGEELGRGLALSLSVIEFFALFEQKGIRKIRISFFQNAERMSDKFLAGDLRDAAFLAARIEGGA